MVVKHIEFFLIFFTPLAYLIWNRAQHIQIYILINCLIYYDCIQLKIRYYCRKLIGIIYKLNYYSFNGLVVYLLIIIWWLVVVVGSFYLLPFTFYPILERQGWPEISGGAPTPTSLREPEFSKGSLLFMRLPFTFYLFGSICPKGLPYYTLASRFLSRLFLFFNS